MNVLQHTRNELNLCLQQNRPDRSYRDSLLTRLLGFAFFARHGLSIFDNNTNLVTVKKFFNFFCVQTEWKKIPLIIVSYVSESPDIHCVILIIVLFFFFC